MEAQEIVELITDKLGEHVVASDTTYGATVTLDAEGYVKAAELCRDHFRLECNMFDCSTGIDAREEGFEVATVLYSTSQGHRVVLKHRCEGGRDNPVAPTLTHLWRGADWMERETWDMFGIEFEGHPGLAPRILTVENFEGWPLRKDFHLASRVAKPWPGVKEPAETDEDGNVIEKIPATGEAPGPSILDKIMADQAFKVNQPEGAAEAETGDAAEGGAAGGDAAPAAGEDRAAEAKAKAERARQKAAEARARKAAERAAAAEAEAGTTDAGATEGGESTSPGEGTGDTSAGGDAGTDGEGQA